MKMKLLATAAVVTMFALSAAPAQAGNLGCLVGGGAGGFGGAQIGKGSGKTIATIAGALLGCGLGSNIQDSDNRSAQQGRRPTYRSQPQYNNRDLRNPDDDSYRWENSPRYRAARPNGDRSYQVFSTNGPERNDWRNPDERRYEAAPRRAAPRHAAPPRRHRVAQAARPSVCNSGYTREYQTVITIAGKEVPAYGTACYMPDGTWKQMGDARPTR